MSKHSFDIWEQWKMVSDKPCVVKVTNSIPARYLIDDRDPHQFERGTLLMPDNVLVLSEEKKKLFIKSALDEDASTRVEVFYEYDGRDVFYGK
jgi:hypothetical protein